MKVVAFRGGLGNQIFEFLFFKYLKEQYPNERIYGFYDKKDLHGHNGLEVSKWFDIDLPVSTPYSDFVVWICRFFSKMGIPLKRSDSNYSGKGVFFDGWWQSKKYYKNVLPDFHYGRFHLSEMNLETLKIISESESVSIHIRRGDYLSPQNRGIYDNVCTLDYYKRSISIIKKKVRSPLFFVFSDDIEWVLENFQVSNSVYIDWNIGINSFYDLFLMSKCKYHIIANSSFSFWGAMLCENGGKLTIYPKKWYSSVYVAPDIFPDGWIGI